MKFLLTKIISFFLLFIFISINNICAKTLESKYKIELSGINIGIVKWQINSDGENYKTFIQLKNKGILSKLYRFSGKYSSEGKITNSIFVSTKYYQLWSTNKKKREIKIIFKNKKVFKLTSNPKERELARINYMEINELNDPLSSFINIIMNNNNNFKTIDGRRIYKMIVNQEKSKKDSIIKKIIITEYSNIWTDHKRNDLSSIEVKMDMLNKNNFFPDIIKIKHKGLVFKLTKI